MTRRVSVGERDGRSVVLRDETVPPVRVGRSAVELIWGTNVAATVPADLDPPVEFAFPEPGGALVMTWEVPPDSSEPVSGVSGPGFHRSDTVDVDLIVSGTLVLELDDGLEVELNSGDIVVVTGNMHAWHNRSGAPVRMMGILMGARRLD